MDPDNETAEPTQTNTTTSSQTGDNAGRSGQCAETITADTAQNLAEINQNMSKMAALLQKMFERDAAPPTISHHDNEHCDTHSDASALSDTDHRDDISVTASDSDIRAFLAHDCTSAEQAGTTQTDSPTSDNPSNAHKIDLLNEIDLNLSEDDPVGPKFMITWLILRTRDGVLRYPMINLRQCCLNILNLQIVATCQCQK